MLSIAIKPDLSSLGEGFKNLDIKKDLDVIIEEVAFTVERYAKQVTPVDTGRLMNSIGTSLLGPGKAVVATDADYALFVHEGTKFMKGRPFMKYGVEFAEKKLSGQEIADRLDIKVRDKLRKLS